MAKKYSFCFTRLALYNQSMGFVYLPICLIFFFTSLSAQWANGIGGTGADRTNGIAYDASGNVYITGQFTGTVDFDPGVGVANLVSVGQEDIFFAKYNSSGVFQWANNIGGGSIDRSYAIAVDGSSNVFIAGIFQGTADFDPSVSTVNLTSAGAGDIFLAKYNSSGAYVMAFNIGGIGTEDAKAIALDAGGNIYLTGDFRLTVDFDPGAGTTSLTSIGNGDIFIAKYTSTGSLVFVKGFGGTGNDIGNGIAVDGIGQIAITGSFSTTVDFGGGNLTSNGSTDIFFAVYDNSGNYYLANSFGGTSADVGYDLCLDAGNSDIYLTGQYEGTIDFNPGAGTNNLTSVGVSDIFFAKYDGNGGYILAKSLGGSGADAGLGIALDASNNIYLTGNFTGNDPDFDPGAGTTTLTDAGGSGMFYSKYNTYGALQWAFGIGSSSNESGQCIAVDASNNVYVGGYFGGTVDFDPGAGTTSLISGGGDDLFVAKYTSSGALPVELTNFSVSERGRSIELNWKTATEVNNYGFEIEKNRIQNSEFSGQNKTEQWIKVGFIEGNGTTNTPKEYSFSDKNLSAGTYLYRLKQIDRDGKFEYSKEIEVSFANTPAEFALAQNYPNPFNPTTMINYQIPMNGQVTLKIYDAIGREVSTLVNEAKEAGIYSATFDGSKIPSGIYFAKLQSGEKVQLKKMVLLK